MQSNLDRYKKDIERLIELGETLKYTLYNIADPADFKKQLEKKLTKDKAAEFISKLPNDFNAIYERWYSESGATIKQLLPDRAQDFVSCYDRPKGRKELTYANYVMKDFLQRLVRKNHFEETVVGLSAAIPMFEQQLNILKAASSRLESSLFDIEELTRADLFDSELDAARELLKNKFVRPAGAIAGVLIEKHLKQICAHHKIIVTKKHPTISDLNEILRSNKIIEQHQWREITYLADLRNLCDHHKEKEPTVEQVGDLLDGTNKIIKTIH